MDPNTNNVVPLRGTPQRGAREQGNFYQPEYRLNQERLDQASAELPGMNPRIQRLRKKSFDAEPSLSIERALHQTGFYKQHNGKYSVPVMRALTFLDHCEKKTLYFDRDELIVGVDLSQRGRFSRAERAGKTTLHDQPG